MLNRRRFLQYAVAASVSVCATPAAFGRVGGTERTLRLYNTHTGERVRATYWADGDYVTEGLTVVNQVLRDFRTGDVFPIDPALLDLLHALQAQTGVDNDFHVISGYRSPGTNALLRVRSTGVAEHSLHMDGKAIDIRLPGVALGDLRRAAMALRRGGVGYYPQSDFVHVDTGPIRHW
jgi:uncharacterized protein YcbK (DUF882 family)